MLILLSPAKSLDFETPLGAAAQAHEATRPAFVPQAQELIEVLRAYSPAQVAALMQLSDKLALLNFARYQAWSPRHSARNARPALLAFDGDVYGGLAAPSLSADDLAWAQRHLGMLSGLYGVLRPLDRMQPYRLEMGTTLRAGAAANLYQFWAPRIADWLNQRQAAEREPVIVNLASQEYFKAVDTRALNARVVECQFEDWHGGQYKIISFFAKRARGLMARHAILRRAKSPRELQDFSAEGYAYDAGASQPQRLVFRRKIPSS